MAEERDPQRTAESSQPGDGDPDETQVSGRPGSGETKASEQPPSSSSDETKASVRPEGGGRREENIIAPSMGPGTVVHREPPQQRLARHEQSPVDAMGHDKRRPVVGGTYGPTKTKQATLYGVALAVAVGLGIGGVILVNELDQPPPPPDKKSEMAPWAGNEREPRDAIARPTVIDGL